MKTVSMRSAPSARLSYCLAWLGHPSASASALPTLKAPPCRALPLPTTPPSLRTCFQRVCVLQHNVERLAGQLSGGAHDEAHRAFAPLQRHAHLQAAGLWGGGGQG